MRSSHDQLQNGHANLISFSLCCTPFLSCLSYPPLYSPHGPLISMPCSGSYLRCLLAVPVPLSQTMLCSLPAVPIPIHDTFPASSPCTLFVPCHLYPQPHLCYIPCQLSPSPFMRCSLATPSPNHSVFPTKSSLSRSMLHYPSMPHILVHVVFPASSPQIHPCYIPC